MVDLKMIETGLSGAYLIESEPHHDDRGYFMRTFASELWKDGGLDGRVAHTNLSGNTRAGTIRGLHYQTAPWGEAKTVHCISGRIWDVIVDIRPQSETFLRWESFELTPGRILYVPEGFAHGFQTLEDDSVVLYHMSAGYNPEAARGIRWDDPALGITWPLELTVISERDATMTPIEAGWSPIESPQSEEEAS